MATRQEAGANTLYEWLRKQDRAEEASESKRLLYVATTRAIRTLSLFASTADEEQKPPPGSLLRLLLPHLRPEEVECSSSPETKIEEGEKPKPRQTLFRLRRDYSWTPPITLEPLKESSLVQCRSLSSSDIAPIGVQIEIAVGNLVHRALHEMGVDPSLQHITEARKKLWGTQLRHEGLDARDTELALATAIAHIQRVLEDPDGRWILFENHRDSGFERQYCAYRDGRLVPAVLDRTFVDRDGDRWIIDYKTGEFGAVASQLKRVRDMQYKEQLRGYARVLAMTEDRPIRTAVYFTSIPVLVEFSLEAETPKLVD